MSADLSSICDAAVLHFVRAEKTTLLEGQVAAGLGMRRERVRASLRRLTASGRLQVEPVRVVLATFEGYRAT